MNDGRFVGSLQIGDPHASNDDGGESVDTLARIVEPVSGASSASACW